MKRVIAVTFTVAFPMSQCWHSMSGSCCDVQGTGVHGSVEQRDTLRQHQHPSAHRSGDSGGPSVGVCHPSCDIAVIFRSTLYWSRRNYVCVLQGSQLCFLSHLRSGRFYAPLPDVALLPSLAGFYPTFIRRCGRVSNSATSHPLTQTVGVG